MKRLRRDLNAWPLAFCGSQKSEKNQRLRGELSLFGGARKIPEYPGKAPQEAGTGETVQFSIPEAQNFYSVLLPNGKYYAYAWAPNYNLEGAYTNSTGLMKTFIVTGGQITANIHLCDWSPYPHGRGQ